MSNLSKFIAHNEKKGELFRVVIHKRPGLAGILQTVTIMKKLKNKYKTDMGIRTLAVGLVRDYRTDRERADRLFRYLKKRLKYVPDVAGVETLQTPYYMLKYGGGDCDDLSLIMAVFLECVGIETRFQIAGKGSRFTHIYTIARINSRYIPYDLTLASPGKIAANYTIFRAL